MTDATPPRCPVELIIWFTKCMIHYLRCTRLPRVLVYKITIFMSTCYSLQSGFLNLPSLDQMHKYVKCCEANLQLFQWNPEEFLSRFVKMEETWIHYYTSQIKNAFQKENQQQRNQNVLSVGKVISSLFLDSWWYNIHRFSGKRQDYHWTVLCLFTGLSV